MSERMLRAMIVDDEAPARALLREYLAAHDGIEVAAECANGFEAVKAAAASPPDVVFLDVQMPRLDGFEVLELLDPRTAVVFCTAYDEFALRAFEVHAVDYLLKPFGRERFAAALARVRERLAGAAAPAASPAALAAEARGPGRFAGRIVVRDGAQVEVIALDAIDWLEAQDDYVAVHAGGRTHLKRATLAELAASLDPARFVRVHRSYVVPLERIARLELLARDSRVAVLRDGRTLPVSRAGWARLRELM